jgi:hypothetical protein
MENGQSTKRLQYFRTHIEMFIPHPTYDKTVAFVVGMNHHSDGKMLIGFEKWLQIKFGYYSKFYWAEIIRQQFIRTATCRGNDTDIDFLLCLVEQFVAEQEQCAT